MNMDNGASSYRRFLAGDDEGLVELIGDYKDGLILYLNSFTGNICLAEELMEETFVKLVTKRPGFGHRCTFKTWLYTIGRNVATDYLRRCSRFKELSPENLEQLADDEESLEQSYLRTEERIILHRALHRLKPEYSQVLYLLYFEDFDNSQTAVIMKKSKRQIENLAYRAKKSLRQELEKEDFVYEE